MSGPEAPARRRVGLRRWFDNRPIRIKLILSIWIGTILAIIVVAGVRFVVVRQRLLEIEGQRLRSTAVSQADAIAALLAGELDLIQSAGLNRYIQDSVSAANAAYPPDEQERAALLRQRQAAWANGEPDAAVAAMRANPMGVELREYAGLTPEFTDILVIDRFGGLVAAAAQPGAYAYTDTPWWRAAWNNGAGAIIAEAQAGADSGAELRFVLAAPIYGHGSSDVIGVVAGLYQPTKLLRILQSAAFGSSGHVDILLGDGRLLTPEGAIEPLEPATLAALRRPPSAPYQMLPFEGVSALVSQAAVRSDVPRDGAAIEALGWTVIAEQASSEVLSPLTSARSASVISVLLASALALLLGWGLARRLTRPIERLTMDAQRIAGGDLAHPVRVSQADEIGRLASSLTVMTHSLIERIATEQQARAEADLLRQEEQAVRAELEQLTAQLEDQVRERTAALEAAMRQAQEAAEAAEAANRTKSTFLATMSHELRTPLNAVLGYSELLSELAEAQGLTSMIPKLKRISDAGRHLLGLINDVLDLSKIEAGKMDFEISTVALDGALEQALRMVEGQAEKQHNRLSLSLETARPTIATDAGKLQQILINLLANACKFTSDGAITLTAREAAHPERGGAWLAIAVADTGIGIEPAQLARLFQPFTQADASTTRKYGGTGLGLALSLRLAQVIGGTITVASAPGVGSTFTLWLPADEAARAHGVAAQHDHADPDGQQSEQSADQPAS